MLSLVISKNNSPSTPLGVLYLRCSSRLIVTKLLLSQAVIFMGVSRCFTRHSRQQDDFLWYLKEFHDSSKGNYGNQMFRFNLKNDKLTVKGRDVIRRNWLTFPYLFACPFYYRKESQLSGWIKNYRHTYLLMGRYEHKWDNVFFLLALTEAIHDEWRS